MRRHRSITLAIGLAVALMSVAAAVAYLQSTVNAYLASAVNGPASAVYVSVPPGIHGPAAPSAAELRAALAFTRCMRKHGFSNFPDPQTIYGPDSGFTLGRGQYFPNTSATAFQSPASLHAANACGVQLPSLPLLPANSKPPS